MVKIRLMRIGTKRQPFYRVVAVDERKKRTGAYLELLGTYDPLTHPHEIKLKQDRIDDWVKKGALLSDGFLRIIGKAPQRPPRKPKKEKSTQPSDISSQTINPQPTETITTQDEMIANATPESEQPVEPAVETSKEESPAPAEEKPV